MFLVPNPCLTTGSRDVLQFVQVTDKQLAQLIQLGKQLTGGFKPSLWGKMLKCFQYDNEMEKENLLDIKSSNHKLGFVVALASNLKEVDGDTRNRFKSLGIKEVQL